MRLLGGVALAGCCLLCSGCLGLIRTILYPVETAKAVGADLAYNVGNELAGGGLDEAAIASESLANVERMIEEHPDAANIGSLERLRDHLREETQGVGADGRGLEGLETVEGTEPGSLDQSRLYPVPVPVDEFERRRLDFLDDSLESRFLTWPGRPEAGKGGLLIEWASHRPERQRLAEARYFTVHPRRGGLVPEGADYPSIFLDEDTIRTTPMQQHLLEGGRFLREEEKIDTRRELEVRPREPDQRF